MKYEHVCFHFRPLAIAHCRGFTNNGKPCMPIINLDEVPNDISYQSVACFQEVIDEDNYHVLIFFDITEQHFVE